MTYEQQSKEARLKVLELIFSAQSSHAGSNLSCIDIMTVLFDKIDLDKDKFVLSAGWKAATLYYFLWKKGRITLEELDSFCQPGSKFIGLAEPVIPEIQIAGGSMGYGLPGAVGLALSKKMKGEEGKVYCLMSDGELAIGTTWEGALIASQHNLDNLYVIIDDNKLQAMGEVKDVLSSLFPYFTPKKWDIIEIDGHDFLEIEDSLSLTDTFNRPKLIIANTVKGKGVSFMENQNLYHYKQLSEQEYNEAKQCLS